MKKSELRNIIKEEIKMMNLYESKRYVFGEFESHALNGEDPKIFAKKYNGTGADILFLDDGTAQVTKRMQNLTYHGKDGKIKNTDGIMYIYSTYDESFYKPDDFFKMLKSVYFGRKTKIKPINV